MWWKLLIAGILLAAVVAGAMLYVAFYPVVPSQPVRLVIHRGETTSQVASGLDSLGLVRSKRLFIWWAKYRKIDRLLKPGRYEFTGPTAMTDIIDALRLGAPPVRVTIPEGWTVEKIAPRMARELGTDSAAFVAETHDTVSLRRWGVRADRLEGYLLPETYEFYWGMTPVEVIDRMAQDGRAVFTDSLVRRMNSMGWDRHAVLTLAAMIEAETGEASERRSVSGVFHNRLKLGMPMQCDPTVIYAMGGLPNGRPLVAKDLEFNSPYNTYLTLGLPPGPICNPGRAAILAALYPDSTDDLYFVADGAGHHIFSRTLEQHNMARMRVHREISRN